MFQVLGAMTFNIILLYIVVTSNAEYCIIAARKSQKKEGIRKND